MKPSVFVSYRRSDERFGAGALADELTARFGRDQVFLDRSSMRPGEQFPKRLRRGLEECSVLVAVIGPTWLDLRDEEGSRLLDRPDDWVRQEIATALARKIPVVPVLTDGAPPPRSDCLPDDIRALSVVHVHRVGHERLSEDTAALADRLTELVPELALAEVVLVPRRLEPGGVPSALLRAEYGVVRFAGRVDDLVRLRMWAERWGTFSAVLVTGPAGQGKTRLAQQFVLDLELDGWNGGLVDERASPDSLRRCAGLTTPALLVFDYAETRVEQILVTARALLERPRKAPVRMLLLARGGGDWLRVLRMDRDERVAAAFELIDEHPLAPFVPEVLDRHAEHARAYRAFAMRPEFAGVEADAPAPFDIADPRYERVLDVHAAALATLLDRVAGTAAGGRDPIARVLHHEYRYWRRAADAFALPDPHPGRLDQLTAAATLFGADHDDDARALLGSLRTLAGQPPDVVDRYLRWTQHLYPGPRALNPLQPDRLGEDHVAATVQREPTVATQPAGSATEHQLRQAITVLGRGLPRHPGLSGTVRMMLDADLNRVVPLAVDVVPQLEDPYALARVLTDTMRDQNRPDVLGLALDAIPEQSVALAGFAVASSGRAVAVHRSLRRPNPPLLAALLERHAFHLNAAGHPDEALAALEEAAALQRDLAADSLDHVPAAANTLKRLALRLGSAGRHEEAIAVTTEALTLYERLASWGVEVASALIILANELGDLGRADEAADTATRALALYHAPASSSSVDREGLALALSVHAIQMEKLGGHEEAAAVRAESITILRELTVEEPGAHSTQLAKVLSAWALDLAEAGRHEEAVAAAAEVTAIYRDLAVQLPDAYQPLFAEALGSESARLDDAAQIPEAIAASRAAIDVFAEMAARLPDAYAIALGDAHRQLANQLRHAGQLADAVAAGVASAAAYRMLAETRPADTQENLAKILPALALWQGELGDYEASVLTSLEAVNVYRAVSDRSPGLPDLLFLAAVQLSAVERHNDAAAAMSEAVGIIRHTAADDPPTLVHYIETLAFTLCNADRTEEARPYLAEAAVLYKHLATADPDRFVERLNSFLEQYAQLVADIDPDAADDVIDQQEENSLYPDGYV